MDNATKFKRWVPGDERPSFASGGIEAAQPPAEIAERLKQLAQAFDDAAQEARARSQVRRIESRRSTECYRLPDGTVREVENHTFEASHIVALADLGGEECLRAIRALGAEAGAWADTAARAAGLAPERAALQERLTPRVTLYNRNWSIIIACMVRGRLMEEPIGERIGEDPAQPSL